MIQSEGEAPPLLLPYAPLLLPHALLLLPCAPLLLPSRKRPGLRSWSTCYSTPPPHKIQIQIQLQSTRERVLLGSIKG